MLPIYPALNSRAVPITFPMAAPCHRAKAKSRVQSGAMTTDGNAALMQRNGRGSTKAVAGTDESEELTTDVALAADWAGFLKGDGAARDRLYARCYDEFRVIARKVLRGRDRRVLQTTELVHEGAMRLLKLNRMRWQDRGHFLAMAARAMRQVLIDELRKENSIKRGGLKLHTTAHEDQLLTDSTIDGLDIERLDAAMKQLAQVSPERARLVELRFFVGMTTTEIAEALECSERTVKRQWRAARLWLLAQLADP